MSSKRYPEEFKIEAVKQVTEKGHSVAEVAARAGIGVNTVSNLEAGRNVSFENLIRVAMVLGRLQELEELFKPHLNSVNLMFTTMDGVNIGFRVH